MTEKNQDVVRALSVFGNEPMVYHSFGPFVVRPRVAYASPEVIAAPAERLAARPPEPLHYADPLDEPAFAPLPRPVLPPAPEPPRAPPLNERGNRPAYQVSQPPQAFSEQQRSSPPPPMSAPEPVPMPAAMPMPSAPLYPLLAAALPEAAEPIGGTMPQPVPMQPPMPPPMPAAPMPMPMQSNQGWQGLRQPPAPAGMMSQAAMPRATERPNQLPVGLAGSGLSQSFAAQPFPTGANEAPVDRRSLTDMFRVLSGRAEQAAAPPPAAEPAPSTDGQALFRRI